MFLYITYTWLISIIKYIFYEVHLLYFNFLNTLYEPEASKLFDLAMIYVKNNIGFT